MSEKPLPVGEHNRGLVALLGRQSVGAVAAEIADGPQHLGKVLDRRARGRRRTGGHRRSSGCTAFRPPDTLKSWPKRPGTGIGQLLDFTKQPRGGHGYAGCVAKRQHA